jgi:hypothetical protein
LLTSPLRLEVTANTQYQVRLLIKMESRFVDTRISHLDSQVSHPHFMQIISRSSCSKFWLRRELPLLIWKTRSLVALSSLTRVRCFGQIQIHQCLMLHQKLRRNQLRKLDHQISIHLLYKLLVLSLPLYPLSSALVFCAQPTQPSTLC